MDRKRSADSAAMQPEPAAVMACRHSWSCRSPAANTPSMLVLQPSCTCAQGTAWATAAATSDAQHVRLTDAGHRRGNAVAFVRRKAGLALSRLVAQGKACVHKQ